MPFFSANPDLGATRPYLPAGTAIAMSVLQSARRRSRTREALRGGCVFLEWHEVVGIGAELDANVVDEIVHRARRNQKGLAYTLVREQASPMISAW